MLDTSLQNSPKVLAIFCRARSRQGKACLVPGLAVNDDFKKGYLKLEASRRSVKPNLKPPNRQCLVLVGASSSHDLPDFEV